MKVRTDFVTNSSSSSFVAININNPVFAEIISRFHAVLEHDWISKRSGRVTYDKNTGLIEHQCSFRLE